MQSLIKEFFFNESLTKLINSDKNNSNDIFYIEFINILPLYLLFFVLTVISIIASIMICKSPLSENYVTIKVTKKNRKLLSEFVRRVEYLELENDKNSDTEEDSDLDSLEDNSLRINEECTENQENYNNIRRNHSPVLKSYEYTTSDTEESGEELEDEEYTENQKNYTMRRNYSPCIVSYNCANLDTKIPYAEESEEEYEDEETKVELDDNSLQINESTENQKINYSNKLRNYFPVLDRSDYAIIDRIESEDELEEYEDEENKVELNENSLLISKRTENQKVDYNLD